MYFFTQKRFKEIVRNSIRNNAFFASFCGASVTCILNNALILRVNPKIKGFQITEITTADKVSE